MRTNNFEKKPFPWHCSKCGEQSVYGATVDYATTMHHERRAYPVKVDGLKTPQCTHCGQVKLDAEALAFLDDVFVRQLNLLTPEQIQEQRLNAKMTPHELAAALGEEDWIVEKLEEGGLIQTRSLDNLLRLFFGLAAVREILTTQKISTLPEALAHAAP